jgi:hypothetical protein
LPLDAHSLTDDVVRRNFELYGHPDGKQDFGTGIAIPKWVVDSQNNIWVLGLYGLLLGVALPYFVVRSLFRSRPSRPEGAAQARWWFRSRGRTKDGVLNDTAALFFHELKVETSRFAQVMEILSSAIEFKDSPASKGAHATQEYRKLEVEVAEQLRLRSENLEGKLFQQPHAKRTAVLLYAHLFRLRIEDVSLLRGASRTAALDLSSGFPDRRTHRTTSGCAQSCSIGHFVGQHCARSQLVAGLHAGHWATAASRPSVASYSTTCSSTATSHDRDGEQVVQGKGRVGCRRSHQIARCRTQALSS